MNFYFSCTARICVSARRKERQLPWVHRTIKLFLCPIVCAMDDLVREAEVARKRLSISRLKADESLATLRARLLDSDVGIGTVAELAEQAAQLAKDLHKRDHAALSKVGKAVSAAAASGSGGGDSSSHLGLSPSVLDVSPRIVDLAPESAAKEGGCGAACVFLWEDCMCQAARAAGVSSVRCRASSLPRCPCAFPGPCRPAAGRGGLLGANRPSQCSSVRPEGERAGRTAGRLPKS